MRMIKSCAGFCFLSLSLAAVLAGCATTRAPKPVAANYEPNFAYKATSSSRKLDVTVGIIQPQFTAGMALYHQDYKEDDVHKAFLSSMGATFNEVLLAKGFNTKGPFVTLNDMTFPEKKGSDLLLYPEFDFQIKLVIQNARNLQPAPGAKNSGSGLAGLIALAANGPGTDPLERQTCDAVLTVAGNLLFVAQEPLSGERMWIKRLDVSKGKEVFNDQHGAMCSDVHRLNQEMRNAWAKAHEIVYQNSMKAFESYVNGEEFQMLKRQSLELRQRKTY